MPCNNCNSSGFPLSVQNSLSVYTPYCAASSTSTLASDIKGYFYYGPDLSCTDITSGLNMEDVVQRLNDAVCAATGDYSIYNKSCLDDVTPILTQKAFIEKISDFVCDLRTEYDTYITTTIPAYQTTVSNRFALIESPNITSTVSGIVATDSLQTVLNKLALKLTDIQNVRLSLSGVNWSGCFVSTTPTTLAGAFTLLNTHICNLKTDIGNISPNSATFNNVGSCLPAPLTAADTLVDTVNKIKTRLCESPTFNINTLTWGCITKPSVVNTDLQAAFQAVLTQLTFLRENLPTFNTGQFTVANTNSTEPCQGKTVSLSAGGGATTDRYVAVDTSDLTPGTLAAKLVAGTNIQLDITTTPGQMIVKSTAVGLDEKVKSRAADTAAGYLEDRIKGSVDTATGLTIASATDTDNKVKISSSINASLLFNYLLDILETDPTLKAKFCDKVTNCLPDCTIPSNVTVVYNTASSAPSAPTGGVVDDTANTFNWTNNPLYPAVTDYEYTTDGGTSYTVATSKPITGLTGARAIGQVGVRVKAMGSNPSSSTLFNTVAYTV